MSIIAAVGSGVAGVIGANTEKRRQAHIADRVSRYSAYPDEQLRDIIRTYGGEMGEAAQQVLNARGSSAQSTAPGSTITERLMGTGGQGILLIAVGLIVLVLVVKGR